jgi:TonB family protein
MRSLPLLLTLAALALSSAALADPALVPPALKQSAEPVYPPEALSNGITGEVVLLLDIDAAGRVNAASIHQGAGHGFDEAAQEAGRKLVFEPAIKNGTPVKSRILYKMSFTLKPAAKSAAPAAVPTTGSLRTRVRVAGTDTPLAGVPVVVRLPGGKSIEVATDSAGGCELAEVPSGPVTIRVAAAGFHAVEGVEEVKVGEQLEIVYRLRATDGPLEVQVRGAPVDREITRRSLDRKELQLVPGTSGDALRVVESLPGVARGMPYSGMLIVRGTAPSGTAVFTDGTWIPQMYHFGGLSSVIPTEMIESLDFYPGNFSARYGRVMGGIIDVKTRELDSDRKLHGLAQVDMIDARVMVRGPIPLLRNWSFVVAGRRSHLDAWLPSMLPDSVDLRAAPVYYDYQAFVETRPSKGSLLRLGAFGSDDRFAAVMRQGDEHMGGFGSGFSMKMSFWRLQAVYRNKLSDSLSVSATAAYGPQDEAFTFGAMRVEDRFHMMTARGELTWKSVQNVTLRAGPDIVHSPYTVDLQAPQPPIAGEADPGPYATMPMIRLKQKGTLSAPAAFAEAEYLPHERVKLLAGMRADYTNTNQEVVWSPRFNARYDLAQHPRTTLKGGVGWFYQPPRPIETLPNYGTPTLGSNRSLHVSSGLEQELGRRVNVSVEGFYKKLDELAVRVANPDGSQGYDNIGTGDVYGVETLIRYEPVGRFFGWLAYTISRSTRQDGPGSPERVFEYDQTHILTALGSYDLGRGWRVGGRFRLVSGNPYTACIGGVLNAAAGNYACKGGAPMGSRLPAFHQLDVRVDKKWQFAGWALTTYLDVQNAYNRQNPEAVAYNYDYTRTKYSTGLPILPSLGLRGEF